MPQKAVAQSSASNLTKGMRVCNEGESPVILIESRRVQICRRATIEDYVAFGKLLKALTPPRPPAEATQNGKLCSALMERKQFAQALPYCEKASSFGDAPSTYAVAEIARADGDQIKALRYHSLASDQGMQASSFFSGVQYLAAGDRLNAIKHLHRCYQPTINGDSYRPKPYEPQSYIKHQCTDTALKLAMEDKLDIGPFYDKVAIVPASIASEIPFSEYERYALGYRWHPRSWDSYSDAKISDLRYSGQVKYKIWMVKDEPVICIIRDGNGAVVDAKTADRMCRFFQINFKYNSALSARGDEISSILEGSLHVMIPRYQ